MSNALSYLLPLLLLSAGLLSVCSWVLLQSKLSILWKSLLIPLAFVVAITVTVFEFEYFGRAVPMLKLPDHVIVYAHKTVIRDGKKQRIEMWIAEPKEPTRLISVPFDKKLERQLQKAAEGRKNGLQSELKRKKKGDESQQDGADEGEYGLDFKRPEDFMPPKEESEEAPAEPRKAPPSSFI